MKASHSFSNALGSIELGFCSTSIRNLGYSVWQANYVVAGSLPVDKLPSAVAKVVEPFVSDSKADHPT